MQTLIFNSIAAWISALFQALPKKLRPSCLELLIGCIIASSGHISQALLAIDFRNHWTAYYKIFTDASWSWLRLCREWFRLTCRLSGGDKIILAVDDTLVCRSSENAPGANIHFDHAHKANRTDYPLSQLYVALFTIVRHGEKHAALPVAMQLLHKGGNRSKLEIARDLVKLADTHKNDPRPLQLLCDSWYMKEPLIAPILKKGIHCVGQLRRDSALFMPPVKKNARGRPPKYGERLTFERVRQLFPLQNATLYAYGKERLFEFYSFQAKVRFLRGELCSLVWSRFSTDGGEPTQWRLYLSTDASMGGEQILSLYALRWSVEPAFNDIKNRFGLVQAWQQTRNALARRSLFICMAYGLSALCSLIFGQSLSELCPVGWRKGHPMTPGWASQTLERIFRGFPVRACWNRTLQKMILPDVLRDLRFRKTG